MTTGDQGRTPPDAEHYLDLSGVTEDSPGPHFDVVLRGYDRRQVDEHVAGLRRMVSQLRAQLAVRERRRTAAATAAGAADAELSDTLSEGRRPSPEPARSGDGSGPDMVGAFNDRLQGILQAAEQEAQLVRSRAAESLLAEHAESRAALAELRAQRDAVFDELMRAKARLDELVAHSGRPAAPAPRAPWGGPPRGPYGGPLGRGGPPPQPYPPNGADHPGPGAVEADTASDTGPGPRLEVNGSHPAGEPTSSDG